MQRNPSSHAFVILQNSSEKAHRCAPPHPPPSTPTQNFLRRHQVASGAQKHAQCSPSGGLLNWTESSQLLRRRDEVYRTKMYWGGSEGVVVRGKMSLNPVSVRPPGVKSRVLSFRRRSSHCSSDASLRFTRGFSPPLRLHTLHSSFTPVGVTPPTPVTPPPTRTPKCNSSRFLAAVPLGPAFLRPSNCLRLTRLNVRGPRSAPGPRDRCNSAPRWPRPDIWATRRARHPTVHADMSP